MNSYTNHILEREIVTTRIFNAPRELVFRAWTEPEHLIHWWGPSGFTNTFHQFDMRLGGKWQFTMHGPNGADYLNEVEFVEVTPPERLIWNHVSMPHFQLTVLFEELPGERTKITFRQLFESVEDCRKIRGIAVPSNEENFDKLAAELETMREA